VPDHVHGLDQTGKAALIDWTAEGLALNAVAAARPVSSKNRFERSPPTQCRSPPPV
jgi:hypothetical protein